MNSPNVSSDGDTVSKSVTASESSVSSRKSGSTTKKRRKPSPNKPRTQTELFNVKVIRKEGDTPKLLLRRSESREFVNLACSASSSASWSERGVWANKAELLLSLVALTIGYANVWLFPYMVIKYSIVFLVPYMIFQVLLGFPVTYMELALGQYSNYRPPQVFSSMAPLFQGLGWAMVAGNIIKTPHYNMITAWVAYFFFNSFILPWRYCNEPWNTLNCTSITEDYNCVQNYGPDFFYNKASQPQCTNDTQLKAARTEDLARKLSSYEFFYYRMYNANDTSSSSLGGLQWQLVLCLLLSWTLVLAGVSRSIRSFGIIVYFTTGVPLCALVVLAIYGSNLKSAAEGINYMMTPDWAVLEDPFFWGHAGALVVFTSSSTFGDIITLSSFNSFKNNCFYDAVFVIAINMAISLVSTFSIFCALGNVAAHYGISPVQAASVGPNVALIVYAEALSRDTFGSVFCVLFFIFLLFIGLDTVFIDIECIVDSVCDQWPSLHKCRWAVATAFCSIFFLVGLLMCTERGFLLFNLFKKYSYAYAVLCLSLLEIICVVYVYGYEEFISNIRAMIGPPSFKATHWIGPTGNIMLVLWGVATSSILFMLIIFSFTFGPTVPRTKRESRFDHYLPKSTELLGWVQAFIPLVVVLVFGAHRIVIQLKNRRPLYELLKPTKVWCPIRKRKDPRSFESLPEPLEQIMKLAERNMSQKKTKSTIY